MIDRTSSNGIQTRASYLKSIKVQRTLGVTPTRAYPDHPSVVRATLMFNQQNGRKEAILRRLPDLFRETAPERTRPQKHKCKSLGFVEYAGHRRRILTCKQHRNTPPTYSYSGATVGADWVKTFLLRPPEANIPSHLRERKLQCQYESTFQRVVVYPFWTLKGDKA